MVISPVTSGVTCLPNSVYPPAPVTFNKIQRDFASLWSPGPCHAMKMQGAEIAMLDVDVGTILAMALGKCPKLKDSKKPSKVQNENDPFVVDQHKLNRC